MKNRISVIVPCYNEAASIGKVVRDFRRELPDAQIVVYDNNSTDGSADLARAEGAEVRFVAQQGKGHVVRRMFQDVDADICVMVDGDDTYPAEAVHSLIRPIADGVADVVTGDRLSTTYRSENKRPMHNFGNALVCTLIRWLWRRPVVDVMTGYRAFSRRFAKTCPILSSGFEIETEMTLHTLDKRLSMVEVPISYRDRPTGSCSKLNTVRDGVRVLLTIFNMFRFYRPLPFFGGVSALCFVVGGSFVLPVLLEYFRTGFVPRFPTLIFSCMLFMSGVLFFAIALILDALKKQSDQRFELELTQVR